jgi:hypothetical protein
MVARPLVEIAAADADIGHLEEHVVGADLGRGDLAELDGAPGGSEVHDGGGYGSLLVPQPTVETPTVSRRRRETCRR